MLGRASAPPTHLPVKLSGVVLLASPPPPLFHRALSFSFCRVRARVYVGVHMCVCVYLARLASPRCLWAGLARTQAQLQKRAPPDVAQTERHGREGAKSEDGDVSSTVKKARGGEEGGRWQRCVAGRWQSGQRIHTRTVVERRVGCERKGHRTREGSEFGGAVRDIAASTPSP